MATFPQLNWMISLPHPRPIRESNPEAPGSQADNLSQDEDTTEDEEEVLFDLDAEAMKQLPLHLQGNIRKMQLERAHQFQTQRSDLRIRRYVRDEYEKMLLETEAYRRAMDQRMHMTRHLPEVSSMPRQTEAQQSMRHEIAPVTINWGSSSLASLPSYNALMQQDVTAFWDNFAPLGERHELETEITHQGYGVQTDRYLEEQQGNTYSGVRVRKSSILSAVRGHVRKRIQKVSRVFRKRGGD